MALEGCERVYETIGQNVMKTHRKIRDGKIGKLKALKIQIWRSVGMKSLSKVKYGSAHVT